MEAELFREINARFLPNDLGDPTFLFHLFKENTTLHDIFKFEEFSLFNFEIFRLIHCYSQILSRGYTSDFLLTMVMRFFLKIVASPARGENRMCSHPRPGDASDEKIAEKNREKFNELNFCDKITDFVRGWLHRRFSPRAGDATI